MKKILLNQFRGASKRPEAESSEKKVSFRAVFWALSVVLNIEHLAFSQESGSASADGSEVVEEVEESGKDGFRSTLIQVGFQDPVRSVGELFSQSVYKPKILDVPGSCVPAQTARDGEYFLGRFKELKYERKVAEATEEQVSAPHDSQFVILLRPGDGSSNVTSTSKRVDGLFTGTTQDLQTFQSGGVQVEAKHSAGIGIFGCTVKVKTKFEGGAGGGAGIHHSVGKENVSSTSWTVAVNSPPAGAVLCTQISSFKQTTTTTYKKHMERTYINYELWVPYRYVRTTNCVGASILQREEDPPRRQYKGTTKEQEVDVTVGLSEAVLYNAQAVPCP